MARFLDRRESLTSFHAYLSFKDELRKFREVGLRMPPKGPTLLSETVTYTDVDFNTLLHQHLADDPKKRLLYRTAPPNDATAFILTNRLHFGLGKPLFQDAAKLFQISPLEEILMDLLRFSSLAGLMTGRRDLQRIDLGSSSIFTSRHAWKYIVLQMKSIQDEATVLSPQTIMIMPAPPSKDSHYHIVLARKGLSTGSGGNTENAIERPYFNYSKVYSKLI